MTQENKEPEVKEQSPADLEREAVALFLKEYGEVVAKHKMDILAMPVYVPTGDGFWTTQIQTKVVSTKDQPVRSPFVL